MTTRSLSWFKRGIQYNAKFSGFKINLKNGIDNRCWNRITVFVYEDDRRAAINKVVEDATTYGYTNVTVDHIVRVENV